MLDTYFTIVGTVLLSMVFIALRLGLVILIREMIAVLREKN